MAYEGSVELISGITPKNGQNFPLVDASDVRVDDNTRLDGALTNLKADLNNTNEFLFNDGSELSPLDSVLSGFKLNSEGYRVTDANYKILRFRVFAGNVVKVVSDHIFQFQTSTTVPTSGEQYKVGKTYGEGTYYLEVPDTVTYVIVSTPSNSSAHVYKTGLNVDDTLSISGVPADSKKTGDEIAVLHNDLEDTNKDIIELKDGLYTIDSELSSAQTSEGWKLTDDGYRVEDANYKLVRFRVFEGNYVKVVSDHKFQFQTSTTVTASGTLYRVGETYGPGTYFLQVPETVTYVVASTPTASEAHAYKISSTIEKLVADSQVSVKFSAQTLNATQKEQARSNIGAVSDSYTDDVSDNIGTFSDSIYDVDSELISVQTSEGWKLNDEGYRVEDANYQLLRFRVFEGNYVKVVSDHKFQFQTSNTVTASGTTYRVGRTRSVGTFYLEVPAEVTYVVASTPLTSETHCYKITDNINKLDTKVTETTGSNDNKLSALFNAYTSQVSDISYPLSASLVRVGIDTNVPGFVSGSGYAMCLPLIAGTNVRVQKPQTPVCAICFTSDYPKAGTAITHFSSMTGVVNTEFVAESQTGDNYLVVYVGTTQVAVEDFTFAVSQAARGILDIMPQLDPHMINLLKYRPVGKVSKAYIALSCDDGLEPLATYTLPRIQYWNNYYNTNIPLHMALFDGSPVFANEEYTALVKDMCDNHNCSIGIHGTQPYEYYSSSTALYAYLNKQWNTIIEKTGVTPTSVIYPHSSYNDQIMVMTAGFCGICGASGSDPSPYTYKDDHDLYFYVGEKSNCYEIYRLSIKDTRIGNANEAHRIIDYAIAHNLIICPYFHDIDFTNYSEETNNFNRAMLDAFIQYGMEQGVEFINFGDIPYLL